MSARRGVLLFLLLFGALGLAVLLAAVGLRFAARAPLGRTVLTYEVPDQIEESEPPFVPGRGSVKA